MATLAKPFQSGSFAIPVSASPSPAPPPSPASPAPFSSRPIVLPSRFRQHHHSIFDLESSSPLSFTGAEKTTLKAQLDRANKTKVLLREGKPARPLTEEEQARLAMEEKGEGEGWSTTSSGSRTRGRGRSPLGSGTDEGSDWITDDEKDRAKQSEAPKGTGGGRMTAGEVVVQESRAKSSSSIEVRGQSVAPLPSGLVLPAPSSVSPSSPGTLFPSRPTTASPSRSPTSHLSTLLSRQGLGKAEATPAFSTAFPPSNPFPSRQTSNPGGTWNGGPLAAALAAAERTPPGPRPAPSTQQQYAFPPTLDPATAAKRRPLAKAKSLPSAPPPSLSSSAGSSLRTAASNESSSPPRPPLPHLAPSSSFPLAAPNRYFSSSRLSSPNVSPPLPPLPSSSIMGVRDPKELTLHFARRPDMPRKGSMGESFQRFMRSAAVAGDGWRRRESLGPVGTDADVESTDTEVEELEEQSGFEGFEPSVFASPRSNSAASLSSASSSFIRSRSVSATPSGSAASSVQSSPKITTTSLSFVFSLPSPILPSAPLPPPVTTAPVPSRAPPARLPSKSVPLHRTEQQGVDLKQLRQQQQARRLQRQAEAGESSSSSSSSPSATDVEDDPPKLPSNKASARQSAPATTTTPTPSISPSQPRWAMASPAPAAASVGTTKAGEAVLFRTSSPHPPAMRGGNGVKRLFSRS